MSLDYEKIKRLIDLVEKNNLEEFTLDEEDFSVTIKAGKKAAAPATPEQVSVQQVVVALEDHEDEAAEETEEPEVSSEHLFEIKSPMVGVFYRCPSPDSPPYVEVGDEVELGQTIGLIEAMKVFSEVPCEAAGRIVSLPVESAHLVHHGDTLAVIDTSTAG